MQKGVRRVSWQEELRRLDEQLAAGHISADDYRVRRDQVLSSAVSPSGEQGQQQVEATTVFPAIGANTPPPQPQQQAPQQQQPLPPQQFQQQPPPPVDDENSAEKTQIVSSSTTNADRTQAVGGPVDAGNSAENTQIVPGRHTNGPEHTEVVQGGWQTTRPPSDAERTQVVPGVPPQALVGGHAPRPAPQNDPNQRYGQQQAWNNQEELGSPWAGSDFPPLAASGGADWVKQGPEVFESSSGGGKSKVFLIVGLVVLLLGLAAGAYFLFKPKDNDTTAGPGTSTSQAPPTTTTTTKPPGPPVAELPGQVTDTSKIKSFADVEALKYLTAAEIETYKAGTPGESKVGLAKDKDVQIIVVVVKESDEESAATARDALAELQTNYKMTPVTTEPGVIAAGITASNGPLRRAHYASGNWVVRIQAQGKDAAAVDAMFAQLIQSQLEELPANA